MNEVLRRSDRRHEFLHHPAVQALLAEDASTGCPRQAIRNRVSKLTVDAVALGWEGPPFNVEVLASLRGMSVREADWLSNDQDGCFMPGNPPVIFINKSTPRVRARYTVAHEVVHTLIPDPANAPGQRHWKYRFDGQSPVEQLCQVGASEILMPTLAIQQAVAGRAESLDIAWEIRQAFDVSMEAAVRNLVDLSPNCCAMVILQLMNKPSELRSSDQPTFPGFEEPAPEKRLRVQYGWTSRGWDTLFLPQYKSVPDDSIAYATIEAAGRRDAEALVAVEDWSGVGGLGLCKVEAMSLRSELPVPTALCLLTPLV